jgi:PadR family transcriptional regulator, regulatory protein PadR
MRYAELSRRRQLARTYDVARNVVARYIAGDCQLRLLAHTDNTSYHVTLSHAADSYVLRLAAKPPPAVESEIAWLRALADAGFPVPNPLLTLDGSRIVPVSIPGTDATRTASLWRWVGGRAVGVSASPSLARRLGVLIADPGIPKTAMYNAVVPARIRVRQRRATREVMEINKDLIAASSTPIVLAILAERDSYGYAILRRVRELSGGRMEWTDGMLYPVLHRLERLGHVEAQWQFAESGRRRKYYRITPRGRAQLAEERRQWQAVDATLRGIWRALYVPVLSSRPASAASLPQTA